MCDSINGEQLTVEYDKWFHQEVEMGLLSVKANRLISAEDVEALFLSRRDETRKALCRHYVSTKDVIR